MARRRMFSKEVVITASGYVNDGEEYFELAMQADDDGFVSNPKIVLRMLGFNETDLQLLFLNGFVIPFESGVIVITHWKQHNSIPKDRYTPTVYTQEKALLKEGQNKEYLIENNNQQFFPQN